VIDRLRQRRDEANQRGLRIAAGIAEVEYQREVSIVDRDAGEVDETGDSLLGFLRKLHCLCICDDEEG